MRIVIICLAFIIPGCVAPEGGGPWRDLGCKGLPMEEGIRHAANSAELDSLWSEACAGNTPEASFDEEQVVAYFWGPRNSGGYELVAQKWTEGSPHRLTVLRITPGPDCGTISAITYPALVVAVSVDGPIEVVTTDRVRDCPAD